MLDNGIAKIPPTIQGKDGNYDNYTPLLCAASRDGDFEIVEFLLSKGVDV